MAQTKFKLHVEEQESVTHAHAQHEQIKQSTNEQASITPIETQGSYLTSGVNLGIHLIKLFEILSPTQKQQLIEYAQKDDKTASCVIKDLLIQKGIIETDS
jgi:hypothetical protein